MLAMILTFLIQARKRRWMLSKEREKELSNGPATGLSSPNGIDIGVQLQRRHTSGVKGSASAQQTGGSLHQHGIMSPGKGTPGNLTLKKNLVVGWEEVCFQPKVFSYL